MKIKLRVTGRWLWLVLILAGVACQPETPPTFQPPPTVTAAPVNLRLGLASSAGSLADLTTAPYATRAPWVRLQFVQAGSQTLFADLAAGDLDAILVHHIPPGVEVWFNPVALDGLVVIVPAASTLTGLTRAEIQALFSGRLTDWSELGEPAGAITLVSRERGAGTRAIFRQRLLAEQPLAITALVQPTNAAMLDYVAATPGAVGYAMLNNVGDARPLAVDGIGPTTATVADQSYPLTVPLYFVTLAEPGGEARGFLAWLQTDAGQAILAERFGRVR